MTVHCLWISGHHLFSYHFHFYHLTFVLLASFYLYWKQNSWHSFWSRRFKLELLNCCFFALPLKSVFSRVLYRVRSRTNLIKVVRSLQRGNPRSRRNPCGTRARAFVSAPARFLCVVHCKFCNSTIQQIPLKHTGRPKWRHAHRWSPPICAFVTFLLSDVTKSLSFHGMDDQTP